MDISKSLSTRHIHSILAKFRLTGKETSLEKEGKLIKKGAEWPQSRIVCQRRDKKNLTTGSYAVIEDVVFSLRLAITIFFMSPQGRYYSSSRVVLSDNGGFLLFPLPLPTS